MLVSDLACSTKFFPYLKEAVHENLFVTTGPVAFAEMFERSHYESLRPKVKD